MITAEAATIPISSTVSIDLQSRRRQLKPQQSTVQTRKQQAVCVRRAHKRYGSKSNPNVILDGLNMTVPKGTIYGLLGASGCGKTTLLSCIVGRRRLNSGEIWVLGGKPGSSGSGVPGPRVGYMPQEIALYGEFSIRETFIYFGWIAGMTTKEVDEKLEFLIKFLMLPTASRQVKNLSGGQQRRVSFAAALLNDPELLILDEPTVGVDPVLRQNIWDHLVHITKGGKTTVIITTHYIDETRQAHLIGLMRGGHFLAEESPEHLLRHYGCESLEDVFLKLSVIQNMGKRRRSSIAHEVTEAIHVPAGAIDNVIMGEEIGEISGEFGDNVSMSSRGGRINIHEDREILELPPDEDPPADCTDCFRIFQYNHMKALIWKNFLWMVRNVGLVAFIIGLPILQIILFCLSIGRDPVGLGIAVINRELDSYDAPCISVPGCNYTRLSCRFMDHLKKRSVVYIPFDDVEKAQHYVEKGHAWATMEFGSNYTAALQKRVEDGKDASQPTLEMADVNVWIDMSNQQVAALLKRDFLESFFEFIGEISKSCNYSENLAKLPVRVNVPAPVYGDLIPNFTDFAAPGVILTIIFFLSVALTSGAMLIERNEGMLERSLVSGITGSEILFSHVITQFVVMAGQSTMVLVMGFAAFDLTMRGELYWVASLTVLTGLCGMSFGFVVSCSCDTERTATYMALGSFLPVVMLCGIIWPVEGMHYILRWISYFLPLTYSTESLRSILQRGWGMKRASVYYGFGSTILWILAFLTISILVLKFRKG